jgi:hypothetical protein
MRKILKAEATAESIFRSPEVAEAQAIVDNAKRMLDRARKRVQGLHQRFDPEIAEYAKTKLEKGQRTLSTFYGDIAFRKVGSSFAIPDKAAAAEKLAFYFPHAIKKELQVSKLTAEDKRMLHAWLTIDSNGDQDDEEVVLELKKVIQFVPEHDSVTVRTNLKLKVE